MLYDFEISDTPAPGYSAVCILGAGAAGILLATHLANAGLEVTLLEGGGLRQEQRSQDIYSSEVSGLPHRGIHEGRFRTYGGTTTQWGGQILELDAWDFKSRSHVPGSGWPIQKAELADAYRTALDFEGLRRVQRDDAAVCAGLGLDAVDPGPEFETLYSRWCPERNFAKLHERSLTSTRRLAVYTHANAVAFEMNEARTAIAAVEIRSLNGRRARVAAESFVLCLGGIESTRFLLQSHGEGPSPWQTNGMLGKFYQDHIAVNGILVTGIRQNPVHRYFGYATLDGFRYHQKIHLKEPVQAELGTLNIACTIGPVRRENRGRDEAMNLLRRVARERELPSAAQALASSLYLPGIAAQLLSQRYRGDAPEWKTLALALHCEQSPTSASTISLSDRRDPLGMPRTRLNWTVSDHELHSLRAFLRVAAQSFERAGFAKVQIPKGFFEDDALVRSLCSDSYHHMGGTRMAASPSDGIVDTDLKLHGIANGYVCSASVFPSSGFSNPTHTVLALAVRLAGRLTRELGKGPRRTFTTASTGAAMSASMRTVALPGSGRQASQLGFGCAFLLGPGLDRTTSRRLLDAAYDAGIRHFDVARLYGQGQTEALLGEFLKVHPDTTVTTKFGIKPPNLPERILMTAQRRIPQLGRAIAYRRNDKETFSAAKARASLERSLRLLGRDSIDLFLLHEARPADLVHGDLLEFLERQRTAGAIGGYGIGGEFAAIPALYETRRPYARVLQFECSVFGPPLDIPSSARIHYRTFAKPADALGNLFTRDASLLRRWSDAVDAELEEPLVLSRLLLKASLEAYPSVLQLFSTRREEHIFDNACVAADQTLAAPARRLLELVQNEPLGLETALYPV